MIIFPAKTHAGQLRNALKILKILKTNKELFSLQNIVQFSLFIPLYLGSTEMGRVISELGYKGQFFRRNYRKMTILGSFGTIFSKEL